jgi:predicted DNA binding protein
VVTIPQTTDVRTVIDRLLVEYPSITVVSRRDRDREILTQSTFQMQLLDRLTPRQQEALQAAYFARYFESPRGSTGTEVGESLGISQPTFNYHLRAALRTLLTTLFEDRTAATLDN